MLRVMFFAFCLCATPSLSIAQQDRGDREVGIDGLALVSNSSPISGQISAQLSYGKYLTVHHYVGAIAAPIFSISGGDFSGGALLGGEYRYLFGSNRTNRIWPFVGAQADYFYMRSNGSNDNLGVIAPEAGLKFYVSQKNAFEVTYLLQLRFGSGVSGGFGDRSVNLVLFGFKHIF